MRQASVLSLVSSSALERMLYGSERQAAYDARAQPSLQALPVSSSRPPETRGDRAGGYVPLPGMRVYHHQKAKSSEDTMKIGKLEKMWYHLYRIHGKLGCCEDAEKRKHHDASINAR